MAMHSNFIDTVCYTDKYAVYYYYPLSRLYDTAMIIYKGGSKDGQGGPSYDTAVIICKRGPKTVRVVHYMTLQ